MTKAIRMILLVSLPVLFFSCEYRQLCYLSPGSDQIKNDSLYYFENDTIKIVYSFWKEKGILGYEVYNKLNVPLYIDWKKSSFIVNNVKMNYWADETISSSTIVHSGYSSSSVSSYYSLLGISGGAVVSTEKSVKPERITFLAPHSGIVRANFILWAGVPPTLSSAAKAGLLQKPGYGKVVIKYIDYSRNASPVTFRNFLTYATSENFTTEIYLDNEFYISRISQMKYSDFTGKEYYDKPSKREFHEQPFSSPKMFFMTVK